MSDFRQITKIISKICSSNLKSETQSTLDFLEIPFNELVINLIRFVRLSGLVRMEFIDYSTVWYLENKKAEDWTSAIKDGLIELCKKSISKSDLD